MARMEKTGNLSGKFGHGMSESVTVDHKSDGQQNNNLYAKETDCHSNQEESASDSSNFDLSQVMEVIDSFFETLLSLSFTDGDDADYSPPEIPHAVELFPEKVDSMVTKMEYSRLGRDKAEDSKFINAVNQISKLVTRLCELRFDDSSSSVMSWLNRASVAQHHAVSFLEEELRHLLDHSSRKNIGNDHSDHNKKASSKSHKQGSLNSYNSTNELDQCFIQECDLILEEEQFPDFPSESISTMCKIVDVMISAGYEVECCMLYEISRRCAFKEELSKLGFENINMEDVQRMSWEVLENEITLWIFALRHCSTVLFPGEWKLCDAIFPSYPTISRRLLMDLISAVTIRFLNFSSAVVLTKRSSEKLFKFLDMYETLRDLILVIEQLAPDIIKEIKVAQSRLGEATISIFCGLENSIKSDNTRTPVPGGAVHPLTRYIMNYLEYSCEFKETLNQVFEQRQRTLTEQVNGSNVVESKPELETKKNTNQEDDRELKPSAFVTQMMSVMALLDSNLETKSKLYRDPSLRYIFLMNNGRYILQKIKGSQEIRDLMGASWMRKRSTELRQYHKSYQRETWSRVLQCMSHEGLQVNGKVLRPVLKERFKSFNAMFDEIHKTQSTWVVSDEQLQSELRVSISAVLIPAYRSFLGRFKQYFDPGKQTDKYIKYQPEDVESLIDKLFDGNPTSMTKRR